MIKVGSRDSRLAVVQAEEVMRRLGECELVTMKTTGDKILDRTLDKVGGKGLFVKELDRALAAGEVDLTVHSLKDVPMEQPDGLPLIAFPKRADARDALVLPEDGSWDREKPIGCSSARRRVQLARHRGKTGARKRADPASQARQRRIRRTGARGGRTAPSGTGKPHQPVFFAGGNAPGGRAGHPCRAGAGGRVPRGGTAAR